jgi:hypothetical protein
LGELNILQESIQENIMPSLLSTSIAANYRIATPGTKFGTRELIHALITVDNADLSDTTVVDGNFARAIQAIQTIGEVYAVGAPNFGEGGSTFTVILASDSLADNDFNDNPGNGTAASTNLENVLNTLFNELVTVNYTVMFGLAYD